MILIAKNKPGMTLKSVLVSELQIFTWCYFFFFFGKQFSFLSTTLVFLCLGRAVGYYHERMCEVR